jgi:hypothetical protein
MMILFKLPRYRFSLSPGSITTGRPTVKKRKLTEHRAAVIPGGARNLSSAIAT